VAMSDLVLFLPFLSLFRCVPLKFLFLHSTILEKVSPLPPTLFVFVLFLYRYWLSLVYNFFGVALFSRFELDVVAPVVKN
jgi:hypothetical protein